MRKRKLVISIIFSKLISLSFAFSQNSNVGEEEKVERETYRRYSWMLNAEFSQGFEIVDDENANITGLIGGSGGIRYLIPRSNLPSKNFLDFDIQFNAMLIDKTIFTSFLGLRAGYGVSLSYSNLNYGLLYFINLFGLSSLYGLDTTFETVTVPISIKFLIDNDQTVYIMAGLRIRLTEFIPRKG